MERTRSALRVFRKILVANRSEIAIRVFRAATELGIATIAIYAEQDKLSLHRFKADEAYRLDPEKGPVEAYLAIDDIISIAKEAGADAIHPGYGLLSEDPEFAEGCAEAGITFIGPRPEIMRLLGNKVSARQIAIDAGIPVVPASDPLPEEHAAIIQQAEKIGYPLMLKSSWGGGGRGMRVIAAADQLLSLVHEGRREARAAFGRDEVYVEKLIADARHVEVQLLGDKHGNLVHLFERDCTIQRRNQKVIERAPAPYLGDVQRASICDAALKIGQHVGYDNAGTVEFLLDRASGEYYFIEVNPRIQVEHTITEEITGLDIVKAQIQIAAGARLGAVEECGVPAQESIAISGHAIQCRVTTEDPENNFIPDYGKFVAYRGASGFGIRVDGGTAYSGAIVTRFYDSLIEKIVAWAATPDEATCRMLRAIREYRIRGVRTNLGFLENLLAHRAFGDFDYNTRFIDHNPDLARTRPRRDRASKLLAYIADVTVNGHPEIKKRALPSSSVAMPIVPKSPDRAPPGTRQILDRLGPNGFSRWLREQRPVLLTDTTMRDAHQSLLATRVRGFDIVRIADYYGRAFPNLLSLECWGGATFDVALRFLQEDPWERLSLLRESVPNILTQMLIRGANGVGYANYPDNIVQHFIRQAADNIDIFRIFDCFNWVDNMRVTIDTVANCGKIAEGAICYTGDICDPERTRFDLSYYVGIARQLDEAGCHILAIKDMAGLLTPQAIRKLLKGLRDTTDLPIHLHTHDTSGAAAATLIAAAEAGVDAIDAAMDSFSGLTSQPCLGSVVQALRHGERAPDLNADNILFASAYWEQVRAQYAAFESDLKYGASEVYLHEMPGGQFTNLKEQARSMGLGARWHEIAQAYHSANLLFGDIIKVTPSSKVVGDMALMMVAQDISATDLLEKRRDVVFPGSVCAMLKGDLGQPQGGFPTEIQTLALGGTQAYTDRPASLMPPADLVAERARAEEECGRALSETEFASYLMYPDIFVDYAAAQDKYGPVSRLPTLCFFYGMKVDEQISVEIDRGKILHITLLAIGDLDDVGRRTLFFELNGQPRNVTISERGGSSATRDVRMAESGNPDHVAAPMPGIISLIAVSVGAAVRIGDRLMSIEAMKMESAVTATRDGIVSEICVKSGAMVDPKQLLCVIGDD
ncbi:pyruvate carboxylase [Sphingopyxis panaciterrulae]|uniref:pyruvate carboxylase n=1 Tax=Sphingopyxis panaciterrulae TaxID=462372 RepID=UPI0016200201|nr:pyruvate carboxylase [Sphingopyxis panaciterrulae]